MLAWSVVRSPARLGQQRRGNLSEHTRWLAKQLLLTLAQRRANQFELLYIILLAQPPVSQAAEIR